MAETDKGARRPRNKTGSNLRITGWQAAILMAQMGRFDEQLARRMASARRLYAILEEIDGLDAMRWDSRAENHAHHLFMMRYDPERFANLPREQFVAALEAEGVPCSTGYAIPLYDQPPLDGRFSRIMPCPVAERACHEAIWLTQNLLLASPDEMDDIAQAVMKIRENVDEFTI